MEKILKQISKSILKIFGNYKIKVQKIILFGSRANDTNFENSDFDLLIITEKKLGRMDKAAMAKITRNELADFYIHSGISSGTDIIIRHTSEAEEYRALSYSVTAQALKEGKVLWSQNL